MALIDLTHSTTRKTGREDTVPVVVRSVDPIDRVPLGRLVTLATVLDVRDRRNPWVVAGSDLMRYGVADIGGCILWSGWCDAFLAGERMDAPELEVDAAAHLLRGGVRTVAADFPISGAAADMLLHNDCALVYCLSNLAALTKRIVRLVALPLKFEDTFSADARVIAMEDS